MRDEERSEALDRLWEAYRRVTSDPEVSPNFMPQLWARIEAARPITWTEPLTWLAARLLPLAAALTLAMGVYIWSPRLGGPAPGYADVLAADLQDELSSSEENI